ncbi:MAG: cytochrome c oxidase accessory protein CcoG [Rhodocyclaceae bacterium]|nr:cytochrome c oxidase accessory protein CcoG [Rhodocyclaceae bacterium]
MNSPSPESNKGDTGIAEGSLYAAHKKIQVRAVTGIFATWRWIFVWITQLLFYGLCWVPWNGRQAVLLNVVERKFYLFGLVLWPQDVFLLAILLIISAYGLFLVTAVGGRIWCGYACPQTVYTEIFIWLESLIEGDHNARAKLDKAPWNGNKIVRRGLKYAVWLILSLWTGFTLVGYFSPIKTLWVDLWNINLGPWEFFWMFFYAAFTFLLAGSLREQVCKYMCPYARFQGVMFDPDTLIITYDDQRGEPRGARKKGTDYKAAGLGECTDCGICVQVCPTGIDIRQGLQYECIGCAACIDACDQVMEKMDYPKGLIRYSTENAMEKHWGWKDIVGHVIRPRIVIYSAILGLICLAFIWAVVNKPALRVDVIRDRGIMAREAEGGLIENVYNLQVMNVSEKAQRYVVSVSGMDKIMLVGPATVELAPATTKAYNVSVRVPYESGQKGSNVIYFDVKSETDEAVRVHEKATFFLP